MKGQSVNHCPMCSGKKKDGTATFTVDLKDTVVVVRDVPASICSLCGNEWINDDVAEDLEAIIDDAKKRQHVVEVTRFRKTARLGQTKQAGENYNAEDQSERSRP